MKQYIGLLSFLYAFILPADELMVYPAQGQDQEKQKIDEQTCTQWAIEQSQYDPSRATPVAPVQNAMPNVTGSGARLKGAARGAAIGAIADGDVGDAAIAGAVFGASRERRKQRSAAYSSQAKAQKKQQEGLERFKKAKAACLEGKGYTVK